MSDISREDAVQALAALKDELSAGQRLSDAVGILQERLRALGEGDVADAFDALGVEWE